MGIRATLLGAILALYQFVAAVCIIEVGVKGSHKDVPGHGASLQCGLPPGGCVGVSPSLETSSLLPRGSFLFLPACRG